MRVTVEMSLYPMQGQPLERILRFIARIQSQPGLEIVVNQMSTQIRGELDDVMRALTAGLRESFAAGGSQVLVAKILNSDLPILDPPDVGER
jgi:uncharacterized protein YqgV (UPF0045/DUF77 family)